MVVDCTLIVVVAMLLVPEDLADDIVAGIVVAVLVPAAMGELVEVVAMRVAIAFVVVTASVADELVLAVVLVGRMRRSSMISTRVGMAAVVTLAVVCVLVAILVWRIVPRRVGWGRTSMKTTLPVGLTFRKLPSSAREVPGPVEGAALALRKIVTALLVVRALIVAVLDVTPDAGPAEITSPVAKVNVPVQWLAPSTVLKKAATSPGMHVVEKSLVSGVPNGDTKVFVGPAVLTLVVGILVVVVPAALVVRPAAAVFVVGPAPGTANIVSPVAISRPSGGAGTAPLATPDAVIGAPVVARAVVASVGAQALVAAPATA